MKRNLTFLSHSAAHRSCTGAGFRTLCLCFTLLLILFAPQRAFSQVNPDSTDHPDSGKGAIKSRVLISGDSISNVDSLPVAVQDSPRVDSIPTDTTIGPVRKRRNADQPSKLKVGQDRPLPDPKIAVRRSMLLPGLGQIYNRSWWKVPVIYAGFGFFTFMIVDQNKQYQYHRRVAVCKGDSTCDSDALYPEFALYDINSVIAIRDFHRRNRDLNVILAALWYTLQGIDAFVEAHLKGFNVSQDLSMRIKPSLNLDPFGRSGLMMGATLSLRLRP